MIKIIRMVTIIKVIGIIMIIKIIKIITIITIIKQAHLWADFRVILKEAPQSIHSEYIFIFGTSIQSLLSSVPSTCGSVLERDVNCQLHFPRTIVLSIPYKQGGTLPNSCSCQTQLSHSWFVYSRRPPGPKNKSKNINRLRIMKKN